MYEGLVAAGLFFFTVGFVVALDYFMEWAKAKADKRRNDWGLK